MGRASKLAKLSKPIELVESSEHDGELTVIDAGTDAKAAQELLAATQAALRDAEEQITELMQRASAQQVIMDQHVAAITDRDGQLELIANELNVVAQAHREAMAAGPDVRVAALEERIFKLAGERDEAVSTMESAGEIAASIHDRIALIESSWLYQVMPSHGKLPAKVMVMAPNAALAISASGLPPQDVANVLLLSQTVRFV